MATNEVDRAVVHWSQPRRIGLNELTSTQFRIQTKLGWYS